MEVMENPWNVTSLEDFRYYNCPECEHKYVAKEQFVCHATIVHAKARDALPGILQIENGIVISNVQSIVELDGCNDDANSGTDLESSICIEKVEPMSDVEIDENCDNSDIDLPSTKTIDNDDEEDLSEYEKLRLKNIAERQAQFNVLKIRDKVSDISRNKKIKKSKRNVSSRDLSSVLKEKDENCDTSNIEPAAATKAVLVKISKKEKTLADQRMKSHKKIVKCKLCEKDYIAKEYLIQCDQCSKTYNSRNGLRDHIQSVHKGVTRQCVCSVTMYSVQSTKPVTPPSNNGYGFSGIPSPDIVQKRLNLLASTFPSRDRVYIFDVLKSCDWSLVDTMSKLKKY